MKSRIIIGSLLSIFLMLMVPCVNAMEYIEVKGKKEEFIDKINEQRCYEIVKFLIRGIILPIVLMTLTAEMGYILLQTSMGTLIFLLIFTPISTAMIFKLIESLELPKALTNALFISDIVFGEIIWLLLKNFL